MQDLLRVHFAMSLSNPLPLWHSAGLDLQSKLPNRMCQDDWDKVGVVWYFKYRSLSTVLGNRTQTGCDVVSPMCQ